MAAKKGSATKKRAPARKKTPRKQKAESAGLEPLACELPSSDPASGTVQELEGVITREGGFVVGHYKDPLGGFPLIFAVLPIGKIEPTPFQRDLSDAHHKRLA
ncbi:MAG TPA: chromosome partitioning protein ParB, partial [Polyangiaceae bacterium]|nr:chromosome partitioning protein ParB [Polyangiaceae bacterium]